MNFDLIDVKHSSFIINFKRTNIKRRRYGGALSLITAMPKCGSNTHQQFCCTKRLSQIVIRTCIKCFNFFPFMSACRDYIVVLKGINEQHIIEVAKKARQIGVHVTNIMKHIPLEGSEFALLPVVHKEEIHAIRKECESIIKQMYHCRQCRSDAVGTLENDLSNRLHDCKWNDVG